MNRSERRELKSLDTSVIAERAAKLVAQRMNGAPLNEHDRSRLAAFKAELERRGHSFAEADRLYALADSIDGGDPDF